MAAEEGVTLSKKNDTVSITINEFDLISNLSKQSEETLKKNGFSDEEIKRIKNYEDEFVKHIISINETYSDEELIGFGYTKDEVKLIRNFDKLQNSAKSSDELKANLTIYFTVLESLQYDQTKNETTVKIKYEYQWTRLPFFTFTDSFALGWNNTSIGPNTSIHNYGHSPVRIDYYLGSTLTRTDTVTSMPNGFYGTKCQFPMQSWAQPSSHAMHGTGEVSLVQSGDCNNINFHVYYVHAKLTLSYAFSILSGGLNFNSGESGVDWASWAFNVTK
ncbi:hypothetical protein [Methanolapillus ohkumae]